MGTPVAPVGRNGFTQPSNRGLEGSTKTSCRLNLMSRSPIECLVYASLLRGKILGEKKTLPKERRRHFRSPSALIRSRYRGTSDFRR